MTFNMVDIVHLYSNKTLKVNFVIMVDIVH